MNWNWADEHTTKFAHTLKGVLSCGNSKSAEKAYKVNNLIKVMHILIYLGYTEEAVRIEVIIDKEANS